VVSAYDCGVRGPRFESHCGRLRLSRQLLRYTALGTGCSALLQCLGRFRHPPSWDGDEYQLTGWVIITMAIVDMDGSGQFSVDSQPKSIGLIWGLAATRRSVYIHQVNRVNYCNDFGHDDATVNIVVVIIIIFFLFLPSVDIFPREFKNWDIQNWVQIYQSVQSGVGKLSCNKTALIICFNRTSATLWQRKDTMLGSHQYNYTFGRCYTLSSPIIERNTMA